MHKCYNVMITGKVQDIGFRTLIENIAIMLGLRGYVFNDINSSVKIVCCGDNGVISDFMKEIKHRAEQRGVEIENIEANEIKGNIFLPDKFIRLYTDELADISRKLDIGVELLRDIRQDTSALPDIKVGIDHLNVKFESFITEQREHNQRMSEHNKNMDEHNKSMDEHNKRLERILEKLAER